LTDSISVLDEQIGDVKQSQNGASEVLGKAQGDLAETSAVKKADEEYLAKLKVNCANKATEWEQRQQSAAAEIEALEKGIEILAGKFGGSFLQVRRNRPVDNLELRDQITGLMRKLGKEYNSFGMMQIANAASKDPFAKVRGLIEAMIAKLETQATEEADHDSFCKEETKKSTKSRDNKEGEADKYRARIDEAEAAMATLKTDIAELHSELEQISKSTAEATSLRAKENADFKISSKDYKESAAAIVEALAVLKDFYNGGESFLQQPKFGSAKSDASTMILGILETAASDFTKLLAEAEATEEESAEAFKKLIQENKVSKAAKETAVKGKSSELKSLEVALGHHTENLNTVSTELDAVLKYLAELKPQCESKAMTYEERKARREAEMEGLKEALSILEGENLSAFIQRKGFLSLHKRLSLSYSDLAPLPAESSSPSDTSPSSSPSSSS